MTGRFEVLDTPIGGLRIVQRQPIGDSRGFLERLFCSDELKALLPPSKGIAQINRTLTPKRGTLRGLHFQYPPYAEVKFVTCLRGEVFDVAVDLRSDSRTFLQWYGQMLSDGNRKTMVIPEGFAHGFQTLTEDCEILYFHTAPHHPPAEGGLNAKDQRLNISWPLPITEISPRDAAHAPITDAFRGMAL